MLLGTRKLFEFFFKEPTWQWEIFSSFIPIGTNFIKKKKSFNIILGEKRANIRNESKLNKESKNHV